MTGEILLEPEDGVDINKIIGLMNKEAKIIRKSKYNSFVLEVNDWGKLFEYANSIYESGLVKYCHPNFSNSHFKMQAPNDPLYSQQYYLNNTARDLGSSGFDNTYGYGLVNAYAAVNAVAPRITGVSTLLGQAKYTITNLPDGATVQWSAGDDKLALLSQQGDSAVFRGDFYGESSIQATVNINGTIVTLNPFPVMVGIDLSPLNSAYITGPNFICGNTASFNFVNLTSASSVNWDYGTYTAGYEPYTVNISSYSGSPGVAKMTAEIIYKGKPQGVQHEYNFNFNHPGTHYVDDSIIMNNGIYYDSYRGILTISFSYLYPASGINYEWSCSNSNLQLVSGGTDYAMFEGSPVTGYVSVNMCFNNPCGERTCLVREVYLSDDLYRNYAPFTIFPNPATDFVTVKLQENCIENNSISLQQSVHSSKTAHYEIQLWSSSSMLRSYKTDQMTFQLPVSGLPKGLYFVRVIKDGRAYTKKLLVR